MLFLILCHNEGFASNLVSSKYVSISDSVVAASTTGVPAVSSIPPPTVVPSVVPTSSDPVSAAATATGSTFVSTTAAGVTVASSTPPPTSVPPRTSSTGAGIYFKASAISIPK